MYALTEVILQKLAAIHGTYTESRVVTYKYASRVKRVKLLGIQVSRISVGYYTLLNSFWYCCYTIPLYMYHEEKNCTKICQLAIP